VYQRIRSEIIEAKLEPGSRLKIQDLCDRYQSSLSPVREALNKLSTESLVLQNAQRGFTVAAFSLEDLEQLMRAKRWLNEIGLRESIVHGDLAWEEGVAVSFYALSKETRYIDAARLERNPAWDAAHQRFHAALIDGCRSDWLKGFCSTLFDASERYRALARQKGLTRPTHLDEHRGIMEMTVTRQADRAVSLLNAHFDRTAELVRRTLASRQNEVEAVGDR
jgi:DNA-binding GntR family transcriptional regulator